MIPGVVLAGLVVASVLQLARQLRSQVRRQMVFGAGLFFGGALGLEMVSGVVLDGLGDGHVYALVTGVEELLEMLGAVVVLRAILQLVRVRRTATGSVALDYVSTVGRPRVASEPAERPSAQPATSDPEHGTTARPSPQPTRSTGNPQEVA